MNEKLFFVLPNTFENDFGSCKEVTVSQIVFVPVPPPIPPPNNPPPPVFVSVFDPVAVPPPNS